MAIPAHLQSWVSYLLDEIERELRDSNGGQPSSTDQKKENGGGLAGLAAVNNQRNRDGNPTLRT